MSAARNACGRVSTHGRPAASPADVGVNLPDSPFGVDDNEARDLEQMMEAEDRAKARLSSKLRRPAGPPQLEREPAAAGWVESPQQTRP